jgi:hypothetical protein
VVRELRAMPGTSVARDTTLLIVEAVTEKD